MRNVHTRALIAIMIIMTVALAACTTQMAEPTEEPAEPGSKTPAGPESTARPGEGGPKDTSEPVTPHDPAGDLDVTSPTFSKDLLNELGTDPISFTESLVEELVSGDLGSDEVTDVLDALVDTFTRSASPSDLGSADSMTDEEKATVLANELIRRIGNDAQTVKSSEQLIEELKKSIQSEGQISNVDELVAAVEEWSAGTSATVLRVSSPGDVSGGFAKVADMAFDDVERILNDQYETSPVIQMPLPGVSSVGNIDIPAVTLSIDHERRHITFSGTSNLLDQEVDVLFAMLWGESQRPRSFVSLKAKEWSLQDAGISGPLTKHEFGNVMFVLAGSDLSIPLKELDSSSRTYFDEAYGGGPDVNSLNLVKGLNMMADLLGFGTACIGRTRNGIRIGHQ